MAISSGTYKDVDAIILENEVLKVAVLPEWGSKTASIIWKQTGYELLWQNPLPRFEKAGYGAPYPDGDKSGFDEMFPTISRCYYEDSPWEGVEAPDHGEVWSIPWQYEISGESLDMSVDGVRFPYLLQKTIRLSGSSLRIDYTAKNKSSYPLSFIWAAHPLFNTCPGMELKVPQGMDTIVTSVSGDPLGDYGKTHPFPICTDVKGKKFDLSHVPGRSTRGYQKYYFQGKVPEGWCELCNPEEKLTVRLSYPREQVPYLGMWVNVLGWANQYNIAPEPATAAMDRIDFAGMWGTGSSLEPYDKRSWFLEISVSDS